MRGEREAQRHAEGVAHSPTHATSPFWPIGENDPAAEKSCTWKLEQPFGLSSELPRRGLVERSRGAFPFFGRALWPGGVSSALDMGSPPSSTKNFDGDSGSQARAGTLLRSLCAKLRWHGTRSTENASERQTCRTDGTTSTQDSSQRAFFSAGSMALDMDGACQLGCLLHGCRKWIQFRLLVLKPGTEVLHFQLGSH